MLGNFLLVALGGSLGAMTRYALSLAAADGERLFPWPTLAANALGCVAMGCLLGVGVHKHWPSGWLLMAVGFLGALTTYSAFSGETLLLWIERKPGTAVINVVANLSGSLFGCASGYALSRFFWPAA